MLARFGGAIGIADAAGHDHGVGDLLVRGGLASALFRGRHVRQEVDAGVAVDQDWGQHVAVFGEQDALPPVLGAQPDPEREANGPIARDNAGDDEADVEALVELVERAIALGLRPS